VTHVDVKITEVVTPPRHNNPAISACWVKRNVGGGWAGVTDGQVIIPPIVAILIHLELNVAPDPSISKAHHPVAAALSTVVVSSSDCSSLDILASLGVSNPDIGAAIVVVVSLIISATYSGVLCIFTPTWLSTAFRWSLD